MAMKALSNPKSSAQHCEPSPSVPARALARGRGYDTARAEGATGHARSGVVGHALERGRAMSAERVCLDPARWIDSPLAAGIGTIQTRPR